MGYALTRAVWGLEFCSQILQAQNLTLFVTSGVILGKLLNFSGCKRSHLEMATTKALRGLNELVCLVSR